MKKALLLAVLIVALCMTGCGKTYEDGYAEGFDDGCIEGSLFSDNGYDADYDDGYIWGYDDGYSDALNEGHVDISDIQFAAEKYARDNSEWHPEEAIVIIDAYRNGEDLWGNSHPTKEEYEEAIDSLCRFYMYFYSGMYN